MPVKMLDGKHDVERVSYNRINNVVEIKQNVSVQIEK